MHITKPTMWGANDMPHREEPTQSSIGMSPSEMLFSFNDFDDSVSGSFIPLEHDYEKWTSEWDIQYVLTSDVSCDVQSQNLTKCGSNLPGDDLSSRSSLSNQEDSNQPGINPACEEPDWRKSVRCSVVKDQCIDLCSRIKRLIESDVLSVPTATIAKSSMFHTRTTVCTTPRLPRTSCDI
jgi:hypothetical protein